MGFIGRGAGFLLNRELRSWRCGHTDRPIMMIRPNRAIAEHVGFNPMDLFDADRGRSVYPLAFEQGRMLAERIGNALPHLFTRRRVDTADAMTKSAADSTVDLSATRSRELIAA